MSASTSFMSLTSLNVKNSIPSALFAPSKRYNGINRGSDRAPLDTHKRVHDRSSQLRQIRHHSRVQHIGRHRLSCRAGIPLQLTRIDPHGTLHIGGDKIRCRSHRKAARESCCHPRGSPTQARTACRRTDDNLHVKLAKRHSQSGNQTLQHAFHPMRHLIVKRRRQTLSHRHQSTQPIITQAVHQPPKRIPHRPQICRHR